MLMIAAWFGMPSRCRRDRWLRCRSWGRRRRDHTSIAGDGISTIATATTRAAIATGRITGHGNAAVSTGAVTAGCRGAGRVAAVASSVLTTHHGLSGYSAAGRIATPARTARAITTGRITLGRFGSGITASSPAATGIPAGPDVGGGGTTGNPGDRDITSHIGAAIDRSAIRQTAVACIALVGRRSTARSRCVRLIQSSGTTKGQRDDRRALDRHRGKIEIAAHGRSTGHGVPDRAAGAIASRRIAALAGISTSASTARTRTGGRMRTSGHSTGCLATGRATISGRTRSSSAVRTRAGSGTGGRIAGRPCGAGTAGSTRAARTTGHIPGSRRRTVATGNRIRRIAILRPGDHGG